MKSGLKRIRRDKSTFNAAGAVRKTSSAQKQREKKKDIKHTEKKNKQAKLNQILETLQKQAENDKNKVKKIDDFYTSKDIGSVRKKQRHEEKMKKKLANFVPKEEVAQDDDEPDSDTSSIQVEATDGFTINEDRQLQPIQSYDYIQKIADMYSNKVKKHVEIYNSEDEKKEDQETLDKRLQFINQCDSEQFKNVEVQDHEIEDMQQDNYRSKSKKVKGLNLDDEVKLPIVFHEREIMENIENNIVSIVCGETGSGKSTQIPRFIYKASQENRWKFRCSQTSKFEEKGNKKIMIGITQPRRVAAVSLAKRVSEELTTELGQEVGYQIRYDAEFFDAKKTQVKFMTDGILLKEIESDFLLKHYSVIIIDEAHERSLNSDILISLLTRIAHARCELAYKERQENKFETFPLRIVIMSATLRVQDFKDNKRLFPSKLYEKVPNVVKVDARQFPVTTHYNKTTQEDYVEQAFKKIVKIHKSLPPGGILVFLTGKKEIQYLQKRLKMELENNDKKKEAVDDDDDEDFFQNHTDIDKANLPKQVQILPLYSQLNPEKQYRIFQEPKEGHRLIVLSTNVAETSLTIPNIRYVVDSGKSKEKVYDKKLQMSRFQVQWISQASAEQRAGRAGRTAPGHCYRLFSGALFSKLPEYSEPEILTTPLDQTMLQLKSIGVEDLVRFPYVTQPPILSIQASIKKLTILGALKINQNVLQEQNDSIFSFSVTKSKKDLNEILQNTLFSSFENCQGKDPTEITDLGILLSKIPIDPKCAKMLVVASKYGLLHQCIMIVACMSVTEIFDDDSISQRIKAENNIQSDEEPQEDSSQDSDLETQIDRDKKEARKQKVIKQRKDQKKQITQQIRLNRGKFTSNKSELISFCKLLCHYFSSINQHQSDDETQWQKTEKLIEQFCSENCLQLKSMKEVHFLCLQLEKMMIEDVLVNSEHIDKQFKKDVFQQPTDQEEVVLQQAILSGLIENLSRKCPIFDANGNEIKPTNKSRIFYESQESEDKLRIHGYSALNKESPDNLVYSEVYALDSKNPKDGSTTTTFYMKGVTKIDNLAWLNNLGSELLIQRGMPIHDQGFNSLEAKKELMVAMKVAKGKKNQNKGQLVSYSHDSDKTFVFSRIYFGKQMWKLSIQQVDLLCLKPQFQLANHQTSMQYYSYFAYLLMRGDILPQINTRDLCDTPTILLDETNLTQKVTRLLSWLQKFDVDSLSKLRSIWQTNPLFLQEAILEWYKDKKRLDWQSFNQH